MKRDHRFPDISPMMKRNIVCSVLVLFLVEVNLSSGRHVKDVVIDQSDDVIYQRDVVFDQPDVAIDPSDVVVDQPDVVIEPPELLFDQTEHDVVIDQPGVVVEPPELVFDQTEPEVVIDRNADVKEEFSIRQEMSAPTKRDDSEVMDDHTISLSRKKRKATNRPNSRWPKDEIPFEIDYGQFNREAVNLIYQAMNVWQHYTCLRFRYRNRNDRNYINFMNGVDCSSFVGMQKNPQNLSLNTADCINLNFITHELGHAIGFYHEQNRPDRDQFITVNWENMKDDDRGMFEIKYDINTYGVPYDYTSLMHYIGTASSKHGEITLQTHDPYYQNKIGHANGLSFNDIKLANLMYTCNKKCLPPITCQMDGFQGQDCQCWCRGNPIKPC